MPTRALLGTVTFCLILSGFFAIRAASQADQHAPTPQHAGGQAAPTSQSGYVLKVTTRLVTLDLIATDSHGNPVRDLKPEDLQVFEEHKAQQKIEHFEFIERPTSQGSPGNSASANRRPAGEYSNQLPLDRMKIPPTVLLMDSLNTQTANQQQGRAHMVQLLQTLPADTPVAVFLLGSSLKILQGFTSDGALLKSALNQAVTGSLIEKYPRDDPDSASNYVLDTTGGMEANLGIQGQVSEIQNFEKEQYAGTFDLREKETLAALTEIGGYLSGIPGRKNLIWVSESFPISVAPDPDTGNNAFAGIRDYSDQVTAVANVLTDAQVAVYPVDVRGLEANQSLSASQNVSSGRMLTGPAVGSRLAHEDTERFQSQGTMDELAKDTGGKTCKNSNDLSGCVMTALKDGSTYYELSFYPQGVSWDGKFHKIAVRTSRPGVKLTYRRGYYAVDAASLAKKQAPEDHLRQACADQLPSTSIELKVQALPSAQPGSPQGGLHYRILVATAGLTSAQEGDSYNLNVKVASCEFAQKTTVFRFNERDLPKTVAGTVFRTWQANGIPEQVVLMPAADTRRIRFAVLDVSSGLTGAIDIPVLPSEIAKAAEPTPPPAPVVTTPFLELPDKEKPPVKPKIVESVSFRLNSGQSGSLSWGGDSVLFSGDIPVDQAANGFSSYAFAGRFHCQDGRFLPVDPADGDPLLRFTFHNHSGKVVVVDLKGEQPLYLGDLPVDPTAQSLFDQVWKSSHCQVQ